MDGAQVSEAEFALQSATVVERIGIAGWDCPKCLLVQILVAVASRADTLVEDWSGADSR